MPKLDDLLAKLLRTLSHWLEAVVVLAPSLLVAVLLVTAAVFASRTAQRLVRRLMLKLTDNVPVSELLAVMARVALVALALFFALGVLDLDKTVTSLLAGVGVVGLALGFAFQDIAANFMSGLILAFRGPFVVGDLVELAGHRGRIKHISLRASELETLDGLTVLVPNKEVFQSAIINYTRTPDRRMDLPVGTAYCDDMEKVRGVVLAAVRGVPNRNEQREPELFFESFGDSSINFVLRIWLTRSDEPSYLSARSEAMIAIKKAFDREKLTIPFPIRTLDFGANFVGGVRLDRMRLGTSENAVGTSTRAPE